MKRKRPDGPYLTSRQYEEDIRAELASRRRVAMYAFKRLDTLEAIVRNMSADDFVHSQEALCDAIIEIQLALL